jgi:CDP-diacylglycerol--glycerol-3-phosphate 3-phosphatidyltransferase
MCHPWLAAGVTGLIGVLVVRELAPVLVPESDAACDAEATTGFLGGAVRVWFRRRVDPLVEMLLALGVGANAVTAVQLVVSVLCGIAYGAGWVFTAGWLLLTGGALDVIDGGLARRGGAAGPRGAFVDSVVDRYGECAVFFGLAVLFRDGWAHWAVLAAFFGAVMVSYTRARAEGLGVDCRVGLMQRPERYVVLGGGSMISALATHLVCAEAPRHAILVASIGIVALLANMTALQRAAHAVRRLS